ncbi:MAG TPA: TonB-dependent receptor [Telluria sp.]|jgi:iron complex outermembrane receptor protein
MHQRKQIAVAVAVAISSMGAYAQTADTTTVQSVEVTGSRIKRAAAEGALPVTVVTRQQLEDSGAVTIAEFIRSSTFSSAGQFRPQSGSSAQSFAGANLRGLGSNRTLVLVDGRRVAKAPNVGDAADMNSIPMAAVERIEILTDGASAVYGSEAIGGVINIILRKDFDGMYYSVGRTKTNITGGDREEASAMIGMTGEKGRIIAGMSKTKRDIIFVRDYPWGAVKGASAFANTWYAAQPDGEGGFLPLATQGGWRGNAGACNDPGRGFYVPAGQTRCRYDFNLVAADEAATGTTSIYARGEYKIGADFNAYVTLSNTNNTSFGRYAPVPDYIEVQAGAPGNTSTTPNERVFLAHRFAAAGNRDTSTDGNLLDMSLGVQGTVAGFDIDAGLRKTKSHLIETGRGFVVKGLATTAINNGVYRTDDPFLNSDTVLKSITTTTGRDSLFQSTEFYASATHDVFSMAGGMSRIYAAVEHRKEVYADLYDSLSEAGEVLGSSGSSAGGSRKVDAASVEWLFPITKTFEGTVAARFEKYSDYGNDFSPKASVRWAPTRALTLRASVGRGFRAPSLPDITAKPSFSADSIIDLRHCLADGGFTAAQCATESFQIQATRISNPSLGSEKSKQFSFGGAYDVTQSFTVKADYWNTQITDVISFVSAQEIVNRDNGDVARPIPNGLSITRDPVTGAILKIVAGSTNEGLLKYSGVDVGATFSHKYATVGKFKHDLTWSHVYNAEVNGTDFNGTFGSPKNRVSLNNSWGLGMVDVAWNVNAIGKNGDKEDLYVSTYTTHDLQATVSPGFIKGMKLSVGLVNAFNKQPQLVTNTSKPFNYDLYDAYGRQAYFRLEQKF